MSVGRRRAAALIAAAACLLGASPAGALPSDPDPRAWVTNGQVGALVQSGDTTYIAGDFSYVGPRTGQGIKLAKSDAALQAFPEFAGGAVRAIEPDGSGGWYVGGGFQYVNGALHPYLVHVLADGSLDGAFTPNPNGAVEAIELSPSGDQVYVGGAFTSIGGQGRGRLARLSAGSGAADTWDPDVSGTGAVDVLAIEAHPTASVVWVGGAFDEVGGATHPNFAEISTVTGAAVARFSAGTTERVRDVEFKGDTIYLAGRFGSALSTVRHGLAAISYSGGTLDPWDPDLSRTAGTPDVYDIDVSLFGLVFVAGNFDMVGTAPRNDVAGINDVIATSPGDPIAFDPSPSGPLRGASTSAQSIAAETSSGLVYVGGNFTDIGGKARNGLAALNPSTSVATAWDPNLSDSPTALALGGGTVVAGGSFTAAKGVLRAGLAALDASGAATSWNPGIPYGEKVLAMAVAPSGSPIYIGGSFTQVGSQPRAKIAAVDSAGSVTGWNPESNGNVNALTVTPDGQTVFAGGAFNTIGGQTRYDIAALDAGTGSATGWSPEGGSYVWSLLLGPGATSLFAGGDFNDIEGMARPHVAQLDVVSGIPTAWNPEADATVYDLALSPDGGTLYLAGDFSSVASQPRHRVAAVEAATGALKPFDPNSSEYVNAIAVSEDGATVFAGFGGSGGSIGGAARDGIAELDAVTGTATSWDPGPDDGVLALEQSGPDLLVGGDFTSVAGRAHSGFARFVGPHPPPAPEPTPTPTPLVPSGPLADTTAPLLSSVSMTRRRFAVGRKPTAVTAAKRRVKRGTRFRWTLSEAATTKIVIKRELPGLRLGKRCRRATRAVKRRVNRALAKRVRKLSGAKRAKRLKALLRKRRCSALKRRGALTRTGVQGPNATVFSGRIGKKALAPGRYRAIFRATDAAGNRSTPKRLRFRIVRAPKKKRRT